jgi:hypothetical protein
MYYNENYKSGGREVGTWVYKNHGTLKLPLSVNTTKQRHRVLASLLRKTLEILKHQHLSIAC